MEEQSRKKPRGMRGNTFAGLLLLVVGGVLLLRQAGYQFPDWMFRWEMILILLGLFIGIRKGFRDFSWLILMLIGLVFLSDDIWPGLGLRQYLIPGIIILLGLFFLFAPKRFRHHGSCGGPYGRRKFGRHQNWPPESPDGQMDPGVNPGYAAAESSSVDSEHAAKGFFPPEAPEAGQPDGPGGINQLTGGREAPNSVKTGAKQRKDPALEISFSVEKEPTEFQPTHEAYTDIVSVFSGVKKNILSKQFVGGEIACVFGGAELNLTNADFISPVVLELVQIFGGTKLIVPANWEIRPEAATIFGGIDDKRRQPPNTRADKVLILKGTIIFGGVEVSSY